MHKFKRLGVMGWAAVLLMAPLLRAETMLDIKLLVFEGTRYTGSAQEPIVTASYLRPTVSANIRTDFDLDEVKKQIMRIFNLMDVSLLTEADLQWHSKSGSGENPEFSFKNKDEQGHFFRLDGHAYSLSVRPGEDWRQTRGFRIKITERAADEPGTGKNVLSTSFSLPGGNIAVFGFESEDGRPYFLSIHLTKTSYSVEEKPDLLRDDFVQDAVRAMGEIDPPRLIKRVDPVYPQAARRDGVQGVVILGCRTSETGDVEAVEVYRSVDPLLDQAAIDAVMQWQYEPLLVNNKPRKVVFTITVRFKLK